MNLLWTNRNFLLLFIGRIVTNIGDSIYYVAAMWLVYDLGGSAFYSGLAGFLTLLPAALQFFTGPFVDKWPIKKVLVLTQLLQCILILIIPLAHWIGFLTVHLILTIMPVVAFIEQFTYPSQTKALVSILSKQQLVKGNSLFAFAYQGIDLLFNAVSGILVAIVGAVTLYLADSMTFALAAILFTICKFLPGEEKNNEKASIKQTFLDYKSELKQGFSIVFRSLLASFLIGSVACNFAIGAGLAVLPGLGAELGGAEIYGFYLAAMSTGSLLGALTSTFFGRFPVGKLSILTFFFGSCCWVASTFLSPVLLGAVFFGLAWVPVGATNVLFAAVMQSVVPIHLLGRVNTVSRSMSASAMPIGSLAGGYLASTFSPSLIFSCAGAGLLIVAIVWICHPRLRQLPKTDGMTAETFDLPITIPKRSLEGPSS